MMILNGVVHALIALAIMLAVGLPSGNWWAGAALGIGFYWGREKRDFEIHSGDTRWWRGWCPLEYDQDGQSDFWWPFGACLVAATVLSAYLA